MFPIPQFLTASSSKPETPRASPSTIPRPCVIFTSVPEASIDASFRVQRVFALGAVPGAILTVITAKPVLVSAVRTTSPSSSQTPPQYLINSTNIPIPTDHIPLFPHHNDCQILVSSFFIVFIFTQFHRSRLHRRRNRRRRHPQRIRLRRLRHRMGRRTYLLGSLHGRLRPQHRHLAHRVGRSIRQLHQLRLFVR